LKPAIATVIIIKGIAVLVIVPTLLVFLFLQRFIYNGFTVGASK
jgi:ABC-type maltose transport system permease subunit